jgi:hypothetical protein
MEILYLKYNSLSVTTKIQVSFSMKNFDIVKLIVRSLHFFSFFFSTKIMESCFYGIFWVIENKNKKNR